MNPWEHDSSWHYSIDEARSYSGAQIEYCDRLERLYPAANMASLRQITAEFVAAMEHEPLDWERAEALHKRLHAGVGVEGSGWLSLLNYVTHFMSANHGDKHDENDRMPESSREL